MNVPGCSTRVCSTAVVKAALLVTLSSAHYDVIQKEGLSLIQLYLPQDLFP